MNFLFYTKNWLKIKNTLFLFQKCRNSLPKNSSDLHLRDGSITEIGDCWTSARGSFFGRKKAFFDLVFSACCWELWNERNKWISDNHSRIHDVLGQSILSRPTVGIDARGCGGDSTTPSMKAGASAGASVYCRFSCLLLLLLFFWLFTLVFVLFLVGYHLVTPL